MFQVQVQVAFGHWIKFNCGFQVVVQFSLKCPVASRRECELGTSSCFIKKREFSLR